MKPIKKLDIFVFKNFITLFIGTFFICQFIVMMQFIWKYVDDLVGKGLPMSVLSKFFLYAGETLISLALPLAILLASLISFGNLGERFELLSIKAAGISLYRTLAPIAIFILLLSGVSFYIQDKIAPQAQMNLYQLLFSMRQKSPELDIPEGVFYDGIEDLNLYVRKKDKETGARLSRRRMCLTEERHSSINSSSLSSTTVSTSPMPTTSLQPPPRRTWTNYVPTPIPWNSATIALAATTTRTWPSVYSNYPWCQRKS